MSSALEDLLALLELQRVEENLFRGASQDLGFGAVFGGQLLGQALSAASQTVPVGRNAHSLHAYFLRRGDATLPIEYQVDATRDGGSFTSRRVLAIQKGEVVCSFAASFHLSEGGFEHQREAPTVSGPHGLLSDRERLIRMGESIPEAYRAQLTAEKPIEVRQVNPVDPFAPERRPAQKALWLRAAGRLPDEQAVHNTILAYASDFGLVGTALYPHGRTFWERDMVVASLDHAMWFHRPFRMDEWLLHAMESPSASAGRGLNRGQVFDANGQLVASVVQEGLIRPQQKA